MCIISLITEGKESLRENKYFDDCWREGLQIPTVYVVIFFQTQAIFESIVNNVIRDNFLRSTNKKRLLDKWTFWVSSHSLEEFDRADQYRENCFHPFSIFVNITFNDYVNYSNNFKSET